MSSLTLVAVGKDLAACSQLQAPEGSVISFVNNRAGKPLSYIGNMALELCQSQVFGLCHADVAFGSGALEAFTECAMSGHVCGIVGIDKQGIYRCSYNDGRDDWWTGTVTTGGPGPVSTLDSMAIFFRRDLGLRFDEATFDGFHCHVEDLCLQAATRGIPVTVPAADARHLDHEQSREWLVDYRRYRAKLAEKWSGTEFRTT